MPGSQVRPENAAGNRRTSEETKAKLRAAAQARWAALTPEQQDAQRARLRRPGSPPPPATPPAPPAADDGGPRSPLDDPLGAIPTPARPRQVAPRGTNGHDRAAGPPIFTIPDLPPIDLGAESPATTLGDELAPAPAGVQVTQEQVATLLRFPFELASLRRGPHWKLRDDEAAMVAEPLTRKINENALASRALAAGGDWVVIAGGIAVIVSGRVAEDQRRERERAERDGSGTSAVPQPGHGGGRRAARQSDAGRAFGTLNGIVVDAGPVADGDPAAVDPEAPGHPISQAL